MSTNSQFTPQDEPGKRSGEGSASILPHLLRQTQAQPATPSGKTEDGQAESQPPDQNDSSQ